MTLQKRFDEVVSCIENLVTDGTEDIIETLSKKTGQNTRLIGDAFLFVTGITLGKYIRQRRLVYALTMRARYDLPIEKTALDAGFSDAAAFSKACKNEFGLSPSQISSAMVENYRPLFFERIISDKYEEQKEREVVEPDNENNDIFGVSSKQFTLIRQLLELAAVHGLNDEETEATYRLAQYCSIPLAEAAEFYEDYKLQRENGSLVIGLSLYDLARLACNYNLSFSEAQSVLYEVKCHGYKQLSDLPEGFFDLYFSEFVGGYSVPYICRVLEAMKEQGLPPNEIDELYNDVISANEEPLEFIINYEEHTPVDAL